jgi:hypothetical protein
MRLLIVETVAEFKALALLYLVKLQKRLFP